MRKKIPQFDLPMAGEDFRLVGETSLDGERIQRERQQAEQDAAEGQAFKQKHQLTLHAFQPDR